MQSDRIHLLTNLLNYYVCNCLGYQPDEAHLGCTKKTIEYLIDCGFEDNAIIDALNTQNDYSSESFSFEDLPDFLWKDSLLEKNKFYIHHELHLNNNSDVIDIFSGSIQKTSNAIEMKIIYTAEDVLLYFCSAFELQSKDLDKNKEIGAINYLLDVFSKRFPDLNSIDIMLYLIDEVSNSDKKCYNILEMQDSIYPTVERLRAINNDLIYNKMNKIIWR